MELKDKIHTIRGRHVMLDSDLAELYGVEAKRLNEQVKRNSERFPEQFMFQLTPDEILRSQIATSSSHGGRRYVPYAFTEQGIAMLSAVLRSKIAVEVSIRIINAFVEMRKYMVSNAKVFSHFDYINRKLIEHDNQIECIFKAIEDQSIKPKKGIFFDGQVFDAHKFASDLIRTAKESIILIDNYVDESTLAMLSKKKEQATITIYTKNITKQLQQDVKKFNRQYKGLTLKHLSKSHDRFMIIDNKEVYHIGASLKDLGKKWFAFSRFDKKTLEIIRRL